MVDPNEQSTDDARARAASRDVPQSDAESRAWLEALMKSHGPRLGRYFNFKLRDEEQARDLVTETFFRAWKSRHTFRGDARASTWLWTIAHRTLAAYFKQRARRAHEVMTERIPERPSDDAHQPSHAETSARQQALRDCLSRMGEHIQKSAELVWLLEHSFVEAGELLGESPDTIRMRLKRARRPLQDCLAEHGIFDGSG